MPRQPALDASLLSTDAAQRPGAAIAQAALALLAELGRSLETSQRALVSRDLEGLERATCEQIGLRRSLEILGTENCAPEGAAPQIVAGQIDPALAAGLRAARWRVLYLGRVQAALLRRTQRSLRIVSNRLAGPEASYTAPAYTPPGDALPGGSARAHPGKEKNRTEPEKEAAPCRV